MCGRVLVAEIDDGSREVYSDSMGSESGEVGNRDRTRIEYCVG